MKRSTWIPLVLVSLLLACAGFWFLAPSRQAPGDDGRPRDAAVTPAASVELVESDLGEGAPAPEREVLPGPDQAQIAAPEPVVAPLERAQPILLTGVAIRVDSQGLEHTGQDGSFRATWRRGAEHVSQEVEVLGGSWSLEVPPDAGLYIRDPVLGGVPVTLREHHAIPPDHFLVLRGLGRQDVRLHVVSSVDRRELTGVEVWPGPHGFPTAIQHPGGEPQGEPVLLAGASPVSIPAPKEAWQSGTQYFVRAPGHAWGSVTIDHGAGGERTLVLEGAGTLEVELLGSAEWLEPKVRLWPPDATKWNAYARAEREPDGEDRAVFEHLAPGTYFASVERGWADRRESYGGALVEVVVGERITLPLTVRLPKRPETVRVSGTLTLPVVWERQGMKLTFAGEGDTEKWLPAELALPLADMQPMARAEGSSLPANASEVYAWEVELPTAGSYALDVYPLLVRSLLKVPDAGLDDVDIVVPLPADVEVRVSDSVTGEEIRVEDIFWSTPPVDGIIATPLYRGQPDPETGRCGFRAPAGEVRLAPTNRGLLPVDGEETFLLEPGMNELEYRVIQQIGVRFTFLDGTARVPWDWSWRLSAHRIDGEARDRSRSIGTLWFLEEGTYELRSNGIPGFRSIDGTRIEVVRGVGLIDAEIALVRE